MVDYDPVEQARVADPEVIAGFLRALSDYGNDPKLTLALFITGIVESNLQTNLKYNDLDSLGPLQQRAGWGTKAVRLDPYRSALLFLKDATERVLKTHPSYTGGKLAQAVQRSAFPDRYEKAIPAAQYILGLHIEEDGMVATKGANWELAPSLIKLMADVDAKWPKRKKVHDGSIGDASHAARASEHNPDHDADPMPKGYVSAVDITKDSVAMAKTLLAELIGDDRVWYVIHDGFIYSRTHDWAKRVYTGPNRHELHIHVSLRQTKEAANSTAGWFSKVDAPDPTPDPKPEPPKPSAKKLPALTINDRDEILVPFLKRFFGITNPDTLFGRALLGKVRLYQKNQNLMTDGVVGAKTWAKIANGGTKLPDGYKL